MSNSTVLVLLLLVTLGAASDALYLNLKVKNATCSSVTISWTSEDNRTADFRILYNSTVHSGDKNFKKDASPPHTTKLTDLVADTEYNITVIAKYDDDNMTVRDTISASTKSGTPSEKAISTTSIGSTSLSFKVNDAGNKPYDCWINGTDHRLHRWTKRNSNTTVIGLNPGTSYNITCQKRPTSSQACRITHTVVTTTPSPPENVTITQITCNSVVVSWTPPADNGNAELTQYKVLVYKDNNQDSLVHTNVTTKMSHQVSSLEPKTSYTVEVKAANVGGFGNGTSTNFTTGRTPITVSMVQSTKVTITISGTGEMYNCTLNNQKVSITAGQAVPQTGLSPNTTYTLNCHHVDDNNCEANATFTTAQAPGVVTGLMRGPVTVSGSGKVEQNITWFPPAPPGAVMKYLIRYGMGGSREEDASFNTTTPNTSIVLTLSIPQESPGIVVYNIWVAVITESQEQGNFTMLRIQYSKPAKVLSVTAAPVQSSDIKGGYINQTISWRRPDNHTHITHYLIQYRASRREIERSELTTVNSPHNLTVLILPIPANSTTYSVRVAAVSEAGQGEFSDKVDFTYSKPGTPTNVTVKAKSCHTLKVTWSPPDQTGGLPITGYNVTYSDTQTNNALYGYSSTTMKSLRQLKPGTKYIVRVKVMNAIGEGDFTQKHSWSTNQRSEGHVSATANSDHSILLSHTLNESGVYYVCNVTTVKGGEMKEVNKNVTKEAMNVIGLLPDTTYRVDCVAYHSDGVEYCLEANTTVTTLPGKVKNVIIKGSMAKSADDTSIKINQNITWDAPPNHNNIQHYVVKYQMRGQGSVHETSTNNNATSATLELIVHRRTPIRFTVQVAAVSRAGQGEFSQGTQFSYSKPGKPTRVIAQPQFCHTLKVMWQPPTDTGGLPITGYNIIYNDTITTTVKGSGTEQMTLIQHLSPGTAYKVAVHAVNAIGQSGKTMTRISTGPRGEGYVNVRANSAHSIHIQHNLTESGVYYVCNVTTVEGGEKKEVNKNVTKEAMNVTGLIPDTTYRVDCVAYHRDGVEYCREANTTVITRLDRVGNVTVRDSTVQSVHSNDSITVFQNITWEAPPNHHSIQYYVVKYQMQGQATSSKSMRTSNNVTQATLVLLVPRGKTSTHSVWVAAVSETGQGEFSDRVDFKYSRPDASTQVQSANPTCNSINITWSAPKYTGGVPLENYTVRSSGRGSPLMTVRPDVTAVTVTRLLPNTSYTIEVRAINAIGKRSEHLNVTTAPQDKPLMVSVSTISSTSLHITARPPTDLQMAEVNCMLTVKEKSSYIRTVSLNNTTDKRAQRLVDNLAPYTTYTATCLVFKDGVDQCYTGNDTARTYTDIPSGPPERVAIVSTSSHSFTIKWGPPPKEQQNGEILSYEVEYGEDTSTVVNDTTRGMMYTAEDLTTDKVYQFRVAATTVNGTGPFSEWSEVGTIPTVTNLRAVNTTTNSTTITWDQPPHNYRVFLHGEATDNIPQSRVIHLVNVTGQTTHNIGGLDSFRDYSIGVYMELDLGQGSNATVTFQTQGRAPDGSPTNLTATPTSRSVTLQWSPPPVLRRNGILTHYVVVLANETWNITQSHTVTGEQRKRREAESEGVREKTQSLTVKHLTPYINYTWEVAAVSDFGSGPTSDRRRFETVQDVPTKVDNIKVNPDQKTITWAVPAEPNGIIVGYRVQYWELGRRDTAEDVNTPAEELMFSYSNFTAGVPHKVQVQAATVAGLGESRVVEDVLFSEEQAPAVSVSNITVTRVNDTAVMITWTDLTLNEARGFPSYVVTATNEGEQVSSQRTTSTSVVVGGLMPHTEYNITVQALTAGGAKEGPLSAPETIKALPKSTASPTWILAVIFVALIMAAIIFTVVVAVICWRWRHRDKSKPAGFWKDIPMKERGLLKEGIPAPLDLGPVTDPEDRIQRKDAVLKHNFCEHVQKMHQDKNAPFVAEYQSITQTPEGVSDTAFKSNVMKNRYVNIFPYDHSRVVLYERDDSGSDYINASYIDGYNRTNGYIATQGPTPDTLADFWQMVWEHHAPVIVMLTNLMEKTRRKCERYWAADSNEPYKPGRDLSVTTLRCDTHPEFELRTIRVEKLSSKQAPLVVKHFLYTAWPDHGVPQYSVSIHRFIRQHVRPVYKDSSAPLIVHCSAGAGRTGTYMAIDTMMYQLEERQDINIFEYVERMRTRRTQMVQNVSQYIYVHDAVNDYINCKNTTIVAHELRPRIEEMRQIDPTTRSSGFATQFSLLAEVSIKQCDADYTFAEEENILSKNRYRGLCPYSDKHIAKEDGSYINASEISGYCGQRSFIAAQTPMRHTEGDVWEMIWMEKCTAVVVLCDFMEGKEEMCSMFWPLKMSEPKTFGNIKVCLEDKAEQDTYNKYHLTVSFTDNPNHLNVVVFHYLQWPCHGRPAIPPYLQLMGEVERSQHNATGPTLVMCDDGMSHTGVFITTMAEVERVKVQGEVDIFQTVKAARSERPHMVSTPVDYEVCHDVLVSYLESFDTYANFK